MSRQSHIVAANPGNTYSRKGMLCVSPPHINAQHTMHTPHPYRPSSLTRDQADARPGAVLLDFGTNWCGYCRGAAQSVEDALAGHAGVTHLRIEDGPGRRLGRSFGVRLWPTLIFLRDGVEIARLVRPDDAGEIAQALAMLESTP